MDRPNCQCHGRPMSKHSRSPNGIQQWRCAVRAQSNREATALRSLKAGSQLKSRVSHHKAMRAWKEEISGPAPAGAVLSLLNPVSPNTYWGNLGGRRGPCRLSTDPEDYIWESGIENSARNLAQTIQLVKVGLLDVDENGEVLYR